jgi:sugar transferase (PEP-CTERM system associated)
LAPCGTKLDGARGRPVIRIFRHYMPASLLLIGLIEFVLIFVSAELAWQWRAHQIGMAGDGIEARLLELFVYATISMAIFIAVGIYQNEYFFSIKLGFIRLLVGTGLVFIVLPIVFFLFPETAFWRSVFVYSAAFAAAAILLFRAIVINFIDWRRFRRRILILGAGERAAIIEELAGQDEARFTIVQAIRMAKSETRLAHAANREDVGSLLDLVDQHKIDEIVLAIDERRGAMPLDSLLEARLGGVDVVDVATFLERERGKIDVATLSPAWFILSEGFGASRPVGAALKRFLDIVVSLVLLGLTFWLLLIVAAIVRFTSPGPVFYRQERVGQFGRTYFLTKFRSMRNDAEKDGKPQWAAAADPRVTPIGRFIRAARIDEIPQIFNVLKGDMSFVGPRPERPFFVESLAEQIPFYKERHVVKPGITGWAQVNYPYGATVEDAREKLEYDLYYVKNFSIFLDVLIVIQTVRVVLWQDGVR